MDRVINAMYPSNMKVIPHLHIQKHLLSQDIRMLFFLFFFVYLTTHFYSLYFIFSITVNKSALSNVVLRSKGSGDQLHYRQVKGE